MSYVGVVATFDVNLCIYGFYIGDMELVINQSLVIVNHLFVLAFSYCSLYLKVTIEIKYGLSSQNRKWSISV